MNYLRINLERFNLSQLEIAKETGLNKDRINRLYNAHTQEVFENKCYVSEYKVLKEYFNNLEEYL